MSLKLYKSSRQRRRDKTLSRRLLELMLLAAFLWLFFVGAANALKKIAIAQLAELTNTKIETQKVNLNFNGSVLVEGLKISPKQPAEYDNSIIKAQRLYARFSIKSLITFSPRLKEININDFIANLQQDSDSGLWNIAELRIRAPKGTAGQMPLVKLQRGMFQYTKVSNGQIQDVASIPLDLKFELDKKTKDSHSFEITTAQRDGFAGKSTLNGFWKPGNISFTGGVSSANIPLLQKVWMIYILAGDLNYDKDNNYSLKLRVKDPVDIKKPAPGKPISNGTGILKNTGPFASMQKFFYQFNPWGKIDIDLNATGNFQNLRQSKIAGKISLAEKKGTPQNKNHDGLKLIVTGSAENFGPDMQYDLHIKSDKITLSDKIYQALPQQYKKTLDSLSPSGDVAFDSKTVKRPGVDKKTVTTIGLLGTDARYKKFPYPLKNLSGTLILEAGSITARDIVSQTDSKKIIINGKITNTKKKPSTYNLLIEATDVPVDQELKNALTESQKNLLDHIETTGLIDSDITIFNNSENGKAAFSADVFFKNTSISPADSNLVIKDISGKAVFTHDQIDIENLQGRYGDGTVSLSGQIQPSDHNDHRYDLSVQTEKTPLSDDLFRLLPVPMKNILSDLRPGGIVSYRLNLNKTSQNASPDYQLNIDCHDASINCRKFPYPLNNITGKISVTKDRIQLKDIQGSPAKAIQITQSPSIIKVNGTINLTDESLPLAQLKVNAENIPLDQNLQIALPQKFQPNYKTLSPTGCFDLNFDELNISRTEDSQKAVDYIANADFKSCKLNNSLDITELNATMETKGLYKTKTGFDNGSASVAAKTLRIKGKILTDIKTDISYDPNSEKWQSKNFIANCYDGKLTGRFDLETTNGTPSYMLNIAFGSVDLKKFLESTADPNSQNGHSTGKIDGTLTVTGKVGDNNSHTGRCNLTITDMQAGQLSPLAKLLQVLKLNSPQNYAFDQMAVDSYIKNGSLIFNKFDLSGRNIALSGKGGLNMQNKDINLILYARGKRSANSEPSILESVLEVIGQGVIRVDVTGDFQNPTIKTQTLPVLKNTMTILGTEPIEQK